jgi:hypothetical protein
MIDKKKKPILVMISSASINLLRLDLTPGAGCSHLKSWLVLEAEIGRTADPEQSGQKSLQDPPQQKKLGVVAHVIPTAAGN